MVSDLAVRMVERSVELMADQWAVKRVVLMAAKSG